MFKLRISHTDIGTPLEWDSAGRWTTGGSWIEPFTHPVLEYGMTVRGSDGCALIVNRERVRSTRTWCNIPANETVSDAVYVRRLAEARAWPLGFVFIEHGPEALQITASSWGTAPIHLTAPSGTLYGSWNLLDLVPHIDPRSFNGAEVVRFLTYTPHYSAQTPLADVATVTERATATYSHEGLRIDYPEPGLHALPRVLKPGADPVAFFEHELARVIDRWDFTPDTAVADVSGGMDSANVALTLARLHPGRVATGAMMLAGDHGHQQVRRRTELLRSGFSTDYRLAMMDHLPFAPGGPRARGERFDPKEDPYAEARNLLLDAYAADGKTVVFTGLGGDEAMKVRSTEITPGPHPTPSPLHLNSGIPAFLGEHGRRLLPSRFDGVAPIGPTLWSILECFSALYPHYMERGLWPINPLAAPEIVRLAESLPAEWRTRKRLLRDRLHRCGFSDDVVHPRLPENFQHILDTAMRRHGIPMLEMLLDGGAWLVQDGYLDEAELSRAARVFARTGDRTFDVYRPLMLETGLRRLNGRSVPQPQDRAGARRDGP
ncbi:asparagine synthase (glutamine-hydrolyzing) [Spinactinospora alkalitolerans]|uniref:Asparagine synthase (Glutamine-hydrolyzing) n=1 Tax=Spinactinospora alkalitolerans TaxID=687207 RepID=A0A852TSF8_9ACTN|nr:asparagine synthase (glutamine-hydrolyzing) [Spinactinospora alkalitolerans]